MEMEVRLQKLREEAEEAQRAAAQAELAAQKPAQRNKAARQGQKKRRKKSKEAAGATGQGSGGALNGNLFDYVQMQTLASYGASLTLLLGMRLASLFC